MIRIPLIDLDFIMNLYKIYNLPIYNQHISKSLQYVLEGTNLAITKDDNMPLFYHRIPPMYFGRWTLLHLEHWPLPH